MFYNSMYDGSSPTEAQPLDVSADPAVKAAQSEYDRLVDELAELEAQPNFHPRTTSDQKAAWFVENHKKVVPARAAVEEAKRKVVYAKHEARFAPERAAQEAQKQKERDRLVAVAKARKDEELAQETATMRSIWMQQPGSTEESFQAALPGLLEERARRAVLAGEDAARRSHASIYRDVF